MNDTKRDMDRRTFLKFPALLPLTALGAPFRSEEHHFQYERVVGTSLDFVVWTPHPSAAERACHMVLEEIDRLAVILDTRNPASEISLLQNTHDARNTASHELREVLDA